MSDCLTKGSGLKHSSLSYFYHTQSWPSAREIVEQLHVCDLWKTNAFGQVQDVLAFGNNYQLVLFFTMQEDFNH